MTVPMATKQDARIQSSCCCGCNHVNTVAVFSLLQSLLVTLLLLLLSKSLPEAQKCDVYFPPPFSFSLVAPNCNNFLSIFCR